MEIKARAFLEEVYKIYHSMYPTYLNDLLKAVCKLMLSDKVWYRLYYTSEGRTLVLNPDF